jgi:hypothetical protein
LTLSRCTFTSGAPMTGDGTIDAHARTFRLSVRLPRGTLRYARHQEGRPVVHGTLRGLPP